MQNFDLNITLGTAGIIERDDYYELSRFSAGHLKYWEGRSEAHYNRACSGASVKLEFYSRGGKISFDYKILPGINRKYYSIDLLEDGKEKYRVSEDKNEAEGRFEFEIEPADKEKRITVYFPATARLLFKNFDLQGAYTPHRRKMKILVLGDSCYQGYNPDRFNNTAMNYLSDKFDADLLNQAIGGECFNEDNLFELSYNPDFIIVGFGVNDWVCKSFGNGENAKKYFEKLTGLFPGKRIYAVVPSGYPYLEKGGERHEDLLYEKEKTYDGQTLEDVRKIIETVASETENTVSVNGRSFVPDEPGIFFSDNVHLTDKGNVIFGGALYEEIKKIKN